MAQQDVPVFSVETALASASDAKDSLDGIDLALGQYESGTVAFVRATVTYYYYSAASVAPADGVTVVAPLSGPGRWLLLSSSVSAGSCAVLRVAQDGSGDFGTIEDALVFANANATATEPYTIVACPGSYVPVGVLDFSNRYVSLRAQMPQTVSITAAPTVTPLVNISWTVGAPDVVPAQEFSGLFLARLDTGTLVESAALTSQVAVVFRDCWFYADPALGTTGIRLQNGGGSFFDVHECFFFGVAESGGPADAVISVEAGAEVSVRCFNPVFVTVGRVVNALADTGLVRLRGAYVYSTALITCMVDGGTIYVSDSEIVNSSSDVASRTVVCDDPMSKAFLSDCYLDGGGVETIQDNLVALASIFMYDCSLWVTGGGPSIKVNSGRVYADGVEAVPAASVVGGGTNPPELYVFGGNLTVVPGAAPIPGLRGFMAEALTAGDALVAYNGDDASRQLRLDQPFTPTGTADAAGVQGNVAWDDVYIYVKTSVGWKRTALAAF